MAKIEISEHAKTVALELHKFCRSIHPAVSDEVEKALSREMKPSEKIKWERFALFLGKQKFDRIAPDSEPKKMDGLKSALLRLAREFEQACNRPVPPYIGFFGVLKSRLDPAGQINFFFNEKSRTNAEYADLLFDVSRRHGTQGISVPEEARQKHDLTYGNISSLETWLRTPQSRGRDALESRLREAVNNNHATSIGYLVSYLENFRHWSKQRVAELMKYLKHDYNQGAAIALYYPPLLTENETAAIGEYQKTAAHLSLSLDFTLGLDFRRIKRLEDAFNRETYRKIRNLLAYEIASVSDLNRVSAMATLLFPAYADFVSYVSKRAKFDPENKTLRLAELLDDSNFAFGDMDYPAWGQALLQQPDDVWFYFKCADILKETPKDKQGRILTGAVRDRLYDHIEYCMEQLGDYDLERSKLPLSEELREIKKHQEKFAHLPDDCQNMPDMPVEGEDFGKPGWKIRRVSYNDLKLYLIGRFTGGNCERINGMWFNTIRHAVETRKSAFYVIEDDSGKWRGHSWAYPSKDMMHYMFAGWEADPADRREMNEELFLNANAAIRGRYSASSFEFGKNARHLDIVPDFLTEDWNHEQHDEHKKEVTENIFDMEEFVKKIDIIPFGIIPPAPSSP